MFPPPQLVTSADCGMPVDTLLVEAGFLFVAVSQKLDSAIKVRRQRQAGARRRRRTQGPAGGSGKLLHAARRGHR
jgi:hypothetical protein